MKMPAPNNIKQLRSFLGMINHYGKFIPRLYKLCSPLHELLHDNIQWKWSDACQQAFQQLKDELSSAKALTHFDPNSQIILAGDASADGVGAVLFHRYPDGQEKTIAYASKTLNQAERNYPQIQREALALVYG